MDKRGQEQAPKICRPERQEPVPAYVRALLYAYLTGEPLNFRDAEVPAEIQNILSDAVRSGTLGTVRLGDRTTDRIRHLAGGPDSER